MIDPPQDQMNQISHKSHPLFHQGSSSAGSEPEPSFKPVLCLVLLDHSRGALVCCVPIDRLVFVALMHFEQVYDVKSMPLISERTTNAVARGKTLPRGENRSTCEETGARELISNTSARVTCPLRAIQALARP